MNSPKRPEVGYTIGYMRSFLESEGLVLDCGCGGGNFCIWLSKRKCIDVVVLDLSEAALKRGQEKVRKSKINNVYLIRGDAENLPIKPSLRNNRLPLAIRTLA